MHIDLSKVLLTILANQEVEDGDAFAVTLASGVPADLGNYPEFSEPAP